MRIQIINSNPKIPDSELRDAIRFMYRILVEDEDYKRTTIKVISRPLKRRKQASVLPHPDKKPIYTITLNTRYSKRHQLCSIAHELVHVKQFITEELGATGETEDGEKFTRWYNAKVSEKFCYYHDLPWEVEAFGRQYGLYKRFIYYQKWKQARRGNDSSGLFACEGGSRFSGEEFF